VSIELTGDDLLELTMRPRDANKRIRDPVRNSAGLNDPGELHLWGATDPLSRRPVKGRPTGWIRASRGLSDGIPVVSAVRATLSLRISFVSAPPSTGWLDYLIRSFSREVRFHSYHSRWECLWKRWETEVPVAAQTVQRVVTSTGMRVALVQSVMKVRLTRKHAERIDDVDLQGYEVGDVLDLDPREAKLLIAERWAVPERTTRDLVTGRQRRPPVLSYFEERRKAS
jgi:hypothetical protein